MNKTMSQMPKDEYNQSEVNTARKRGVSDNSGKIVLAQQLGSFRERTQDSIISDNDESTAMLPINQTGYNQKVFKDYAHTVTHAKKMA